MSTGKHIDAVCAVILAVTFALLLIFANGERLGIQAVVDQDAENYSGSEHFTDNDLDGNWSTDRATRIVLEGDSAKVSGAGAYANGGDVVIVQSGYYVISGELTDGSITVGAEDDSKVWILLDGASVSCEDDAAFRIDQADKVFLTLAEGTENRLTSGSAMSGEALADGTGGVIYAHDDLTINGSGSLAVTAGYQHGIEVNDELTITGGKISISAPKDGINANDGFSFASASLEISARDDGIHTDGGVYIESGSITISECSEGIEGLTVEVCGGEITIYPTDDGINASGGSGETGMQGFGMPGMNGGGTSGADADVNGADAENCILISGGSILIVNANGRDADGLDSNGNITITGGDVRIFLNADGGNSALDFASEYGGIAVIDGGTVIACGSASMLESIDASSTQPSVTLAGTEAAQGETIALLTSDGEELLSCEALCDISAVTFSCPELRVGESYKAVLGGTETELALTQTVTMEGEASGMGGFGGMGAGGGAAFHGGMAPNGGAGTGFGTDLDDSTESDSAAAMEGVAGSDGISSEEGGMFGGSPHDGRGNGTGMPGMPQMAASSDGEMPQFPQMQTVSGEEMPEMSQMQPGGGHQMNHVNRQGAAEPGGQGTGTAAKESASAEAGGETWLLIAVSAAILLLGIAAAVKAKSKGV